MSNSINLKLNLTIVAFLFYTLCQREIDAAQRNKPSNRIVGGSATSISAAPFIVNIQVDGKFACGGTLVSPTIVVTAAHCVKGKNRAGMVITGGATNLSDAGVKRRVSRALVPAAYRKSTRNMDVAVLKLDSPMTGANIRPIGLCNRKLKVGQSLRVYGWGTTSENARTSSNTLRTARVPLLSKKRCSQNYRSTARLTRSMFCAAVPGTRDSCAGDSGGPAIFNGRLCGIVSWGVGCARSDYPGVYTTVNTVRSFLNKAIKRMR